MARIRRPVVVLAYGDAGVHWLERTLQRYRSLPVLSEMVRDRVIQFWSLGVRERAEVDAAIACLDAAPTAEVVRDYLDSARTARSQAKYNLDLQVPLVVIERWSLFSEGCEARRDLRNAFVQARHVNCDTELERELDYLWISLTDSIRPARRPEREAIERIRAALQPEKLHDVPLLIDRQTADGAVVDADLADRCFYNLALALVSSDLIFPRETADTQPPDILNSDLDAGRVHPVSIFKLRHPDARILDAISRSIRRDLVSGERSSDLRQYAQQMPTLARICEKEGEELRAGTFSITTASERRKDAAVDVLRSCLILKDMRPGRDDVFRTGRVAASVFGGPPVPATAQSAVLALATLMGLPEWSTSGLVVAGLIIAVVGGGCVWWWRYADRIQENDVGQSATSVAAALERHEALLQWRGLLQKLDSASRGWDELHRQDKHIPAATSGIWRVVEDHPYECELEPDSLTNIASTLDAPAFDWIARYALVHADKGESEGAQLLAAIRAYSGYLMERRPDIVRETLVAAAEEPHAAELRDHIGRVPLLANAGRVIRTDEVLWITHSDLHMDNLLLSLEPAAVRRSARVLMSDDRAQSLRLALGEPLQWSEVLTLDFLGA